MSTQSDLPLLRPIPRRPYDLDTPSPPLSSTTPDPDSQLQSPIDAPSDDPVKRTKSAIALTSSTLFGIYSYTDNDAQTPTQLSRSPSMLNIADFDFTKNRSTPSLLSPTDIPPQQPRPVAPVASAATTAASKQQIHRRRKSNPRTAIPMLVLRVTSLFVFGLAYGIIVTHLHNSSLSTVTLDIDKYSARYLVEWGLAGVALGSLLPWLDGEDLGDDGGSKMDWHPAVRSIGAFVGIAYAIRKLPWQSTLQVSLTLALVNPFLWYLIDRTRAGFWFSAAVGVAGTAVLLQTNSAMIQAPEIVLNFPSAARNSSEDRIAGIIPVESVGIFVWICSVLFCSCVCFGNIGRKLTWMEKE